MTEENAEQTRRGDDCVTVVLTADNHLGYTAFGQQFQKREAYQQRLRRAFQQATDFAVGQGVDLFVQAGDLFDTTEPLERDRGFVATRLAQLRHAGVRVFALGGTHDTPPESHSSTGETSPAPQISYANVGVMHYLAPNVTELEPVLVTIRNIPVGICGLGVLAGQEGNPLARVRVQGDIERAAIPILVLHAPIEGLSSGTSLLDTRAQVTRASIENQSAFRYILAGYHHSHRHLRIGQCDVIVAGATQHIDLSNPVEEPGFVFLGLARDGVRWCKHIAVDALALQRLVIRTGELWPDDSSDESDSPMPPTPTATILERLRPLCDEQTMIQLRLEGELTRTQYHQLDLNQIRRYGAEHCFSLAIDDSGLAIVSENEAIAVETGERLSPREELIVLAEEWIAQAIDEREQKALLATKEELLLALDDVKSSRRSRE
ncbi:MAG TPA: metallophosphoesterase [Ktedonobacteraceae bacterium]|nr:metallophosphoesterase [Ktedonobacteraceae bacterium]